MASLAIQRPPSRRRDVSGSPRRSRAPQRAAGSASNSQRRMPKLTGSADSRRVGAGPALGADPEAVDRLEHRAPSDSPSRSMLERGRRHRRDPARADLVARERLLVEDHDVEARAPRASRRRRSPAGPPPTIRTSQRSTGIRSCRRPLRLVEMARVHGIALLVRRANRTWKSCTDPARNAAIEPAR